ncbi:MAG: hypothetical protein IPM29_01485 [Planctomycetes bacterium]|nr:hypothetical protein [Planctomycetota bacterium]
MRIEPVYLVRPPAAAAASSGRRRFLRAALLAAGAAGAGFAGGQLVGALCAPPPRGDDPLDRWAEQLAGGDARRLLADAETFLFVAGRSAATWRRHAAGLGRLGGLLAGDDVALTTRQRAALAASLLAMCATHGTPAELAPFANALGAIR